MTDTVFTKFYSDIHVDKSEILRYMGCRETDETTLSLVEECLSEALPKLVYKTCYRQFAIHVDACKTDLSFMISRSRDLNKNLTGCDRIIVFAATIGIEMDRLIAKYGKISPSKALCFQAIGAERIESLCDVFNREMKEKLAAENLFFRPRFSPGYGDLPLDAQRKLFSVLDCSRKIGLSLNDSLLMSPSKSVTAIIGFGSAPRQDKPRQSKSCRSGSSQSEPWQGGSPQSEHDETSHAGKCKNCENKNCSFRR